MTDFRLATAADDALIRSMLRENGMSTWVEMAIEREPSAFAGRNVFGRDWTVIGEEQRQVIGMYTAAVVPVYVNGRPERLGYLGGMRLNPEHRRRIRHVRGGYASVRALAPVRGTLPWWFSVVAAENTVARRLLEAGIPGLPAYHALGEYVTLGLPTARGKRHGLWREAGQPDLPRLLEFHAAQAAAQQFAPVLQAALVHEIGLQHFFLHEHAGELRGMAALWDQRAFKQVVARRYRRPIGALLPAYNAYAKLFRRMPLPREGQALAQTFLAFLALADEARPLAGKLLQDLLARCATPVASLGLHAAHPLIPALERLRPMRYPARVYAVSFEGRPELGDRAAQPEAALL